MKKLFDKNEILFSIILIIVYVLLGSYMQNTFGNGSHITFISFLALSTVILIFILKNNLTKYIGLTKVKRSKEFLYFIPLIIIASVNLWNGVLKQNSLSYIIFYILSMCLVGFLEEIIFRGFLFKAIKKENINKAIIITSITFGIGHIVNLLNGAEVLQTLLQILYAISIGYLFVVIFIKSESIVPCIICHCLLNSLSVFAVQGNNIYNIIISIFLIAISSSYAIYINKKIKES